MVGGPPVVNGRNFLFGGQSSVVFSPPPPSPPPVPFAPADAPPPGVVIKSDPHFQGLDGQAFDFDGEAGQKYALLVQEDDGVAMIARFETAYTTGVSVEGNRMQSYKAKGTWITSIALRVAGDDEYATLIVASSSTVLPAPSSESSKLTHGSMHLAASSPDAQDLIKVTTSGDSTTSVVTYVSEYLEGHIDVVPPPTSWQVGADEVDELTHLNVGIDRLSTSNAGDLLGLLGITANGRYPSNSGNSTFHGRLTM
eukprot:scaffold624_cov402-Prasinococcus_capsulatus_cf.AAC.35